MPTIQDRQISAGGTLGSDVTVDRPRRRNNDHVRILDSLAHRLCIFHAGAKNCPRRFQSLRIMDNHVGTGIGQISGDVDPLRLFDHRGVRFVGEAEEGNFPFL